ncbi:MAG: hypothetical protein CVU38_20370 [Chloroflexi bacterium HGW-Chloroflexi-1]|nr:MAG: hypothetical protein CVU38_20370 [Chloroflexi bacterium HGW-Chloroflexi-1]
MAAARAGPRPHARAGPQRRRRAVPVRGADDLCGGVQPARRPGLSPASGHRARAGAGAARAGRPGRPGDHRG